MRESVERKIGIDKEREREREKRERGDKRAENRDTDGVRKSY